MISVINITAFGSTIFEFGGTIFEFGDPFFRTIPSPPNPFPNSKTTLPNSIYARIFWKRDAFFAMHAAMHRVPFSVCQVPVSRQSMPLRASTAATVWVAMPSPRFWYPAASPPPASHRMQRNSNGMARPCVC